MKKVLIVTYYFPPAGGPGVQRWLKFVKYLPDYQIQPVVYVPENPSYPILDEGLQEDISAQAIIIKRPIFEPYGLASVFSKNKTKKISAGIIPNERKMTTVDKFLLWIRGNFFIPDARVFWVKPSVAYLKKYLQENQIDTVITTGPPHSLHLIGMKLKAQLPIRWIADFRDPWTTIGYHDKLRLSDYAENEHKNLERQVLHTADSIIVTSKSTKLEFQKKTNQPITVITNGYDSENVGKQNLDAKFSLAHIGSFLSERNPVILWQALSDLVKEVPGFSSHLELKLIGTISKEIHETMHSYNLAEYVNDLGYVSHQEALVHQRKSQVLLLIEINSRNTISIIPGKLFEYMVSGRPIVAIGPRSSDFAEIIQSTNTGSFFDYSDKEGLKKTILALYESYLNGTLKVNAVGLEAYSRKKLTERLAELILQQNPS
ncbi:glycosyltransferase family 4 protein [Flavobacterium sp. CYK-4]|uniref:glycosyltransferase n=1 Tax=Flavobacterium lotistagni TaxID=2709660 RepID=UPI00140B153D|nr:glycosyltransferase [Flavobacterium lotistagni]NHM07165.1 glycosyltransferase family 4 protein [Flavobacterium lotistagni]